MFVVISAETEKKTWKDWSCCLSDPRLCSLFLPAQGRAHVCFAQEFQRIMTVDLLLLIFVMLLLSGRRLSFVIEAGRMAMACT